MPDSRRAGDREPAAERLDAVREPAQAGAGREVGAALAVVAHLDADRVCCRADRHRDGGGVRVLGRVREALGDEVVDRGFERLGEPVVGDSLDLDRERCAGGDCFEGGSEAAVGEHSGVEAACELTQLLERELELLRRRVDQLARRPWIVVEPRVRKPQLQRQRDESLLGAVVEVALEPAALRVALAHDPRARLDELRACLGALERQCDELGEVVEPALGIGAERLLGRRGDEHHPPGATADDDRCPDTRAVTRLVHAPGGLAAHTGIVVDPRRPAGPGDDRREAVAVRQRHHGAGLEVADLARGPAADGGCRVAVEADRAGRVGAEQPPGLLRDRLEHELGLRRAGNQRRDAPQGRLLRGEADDLGSRLLALGDVETGGDEVGDGAVGIRERPVGELDRPAAAVLRQPPALHRMRLPLGEGAFEDLVEQLEVLGRHDRAPGRRDRRPPRWSSRSRARRPG